MSIKRFISAGCFSFLSFISAVECDAEAVGVNYGFSRIAQTGDVAGNLGDPVPSLNNAGRVAFRASLVSYNEGHGIYSGNGGPLTTIFDTTMDSTFFSGFQNFPTINDDGRVAYIARRSGVWGLYSGSGGPTETVALPPAPYAPPVSSLGYGFPEISEDGKVWFVVDGDTKHGIYSHSGGTYEMAFEDTIGDPAQIISVSRDGRVAFYRDGIGGTDRAIFATGPDGAGPIELISAVGSFFHGYDSIAVNDDGLVAMVARFSSSTPGVYLGNGGPLTTITDINGPFGSFGAVSINNLGQIAFFAALDGGLGGIYTGPDPVAHKIIQVGESLDGSTVVRLSFGGHGLNDSGQMAFYAKLADGREGIYIASVIPEPSVAALLLGGLGLAKVFRRGRNFRGR